MVHELEVLAKTNFTQGRNKLYTVVYGRTDNRKDD